MPLATISRRTFDSYVEEYFLQTSEMEINAFWQRMDKIVANMTEEEKKIFCNCLGGATLS